MNTTQAKRFAESLGWSVWFDNAVRLWTAVRGNETRYWTASVVSDLDSAGMVRLLD